MNAVASAEKRRYGRVPAKHFVSFARLMDGMPSEPSSGLGRTTNVGAGGAELETDRPLAVGERIALEIALGSQIVRALSMVVHVGSSESMTRAGVSFEELNATDRETLTALGY